MPKALVHVRVDHSALERGYSEPGETCEIAGVDPIPLRGGKKPCLRRVFGGQRLRGVDIKSISHLGRTIPAKLRTALTERDQVCVVPGCNNSRYLEIDHIVAVEDRGPTCLENLAKLCRHHHDLKTYHGYKIRGSPGAWVWGPPAPSPRMDVA